MFFLYFHDQRTVGIRPCSFPEIAPYITGWAYRSILLASRHLDKLYFLQFQWRFVDDFDVVDETD